MNCNFDKFRSLLSMYGVVIDTVFDNLPNEIQFVEGVEKQLSKEDIMRLNQKIVSNLGNYFTSFKTQIITQEDFLKEASEAISDALTMVKTELNLENVLDSSNYFFNNIFTNARFQGLKSIPFYDTNQDIVIKPLNEILSKKGIPGSIIPKEDVRNYLDSGSIVMKLRLNPLNILSPQQITENYYGPASSIETVAKNRFFKRIAGIRFKDVYLQKRPERLKTLNDKIKQYEQEIFATLKLHPKLKNLDIPFTEKGYAIKLFEDYLKDYRDVGLQVKDLIQWAMAEDKTNIQIYNAYVQLKHFDDLMPIYSGGLIEVDARYKDMLTDNHKYLFSSTGNMRTTYNNDDDVIAASDETSALYKNFIQSLEKIDANGRVLSGDYLTFEMVNYSINLLKPDLNPALPIESLKAALEKYIEMGLSDELEFSARKGSQTQLKTLIPIYVNIFRDAMPTTPGLKKLLKALDKSKDKIESLFPTYKANVAEMNDINLVEIVTSNLMKVDTLSYSEILYNMSTKSYDHVPAKMKISSAGYYRLRVLGARILHRSKDNFENILQRYNIEIVPGKNEEPVYKFNFDSGKILYYHFHTSFNFSEDLENSKPINLEGSDYIKPIPLGVESQNVYDSMRGDYQDFFQLAKMFDEILEQSLTSDNMRGMDLFKEYAPTTYHKDLMFILGNYIGLTHVNTVVQDLVNETVEANVGHNDSKIYTASSVPGQDINGFIAAALDDLNSPLANPVAKGTLGIWSKKNRYYNIDFAGINIDVKNAMQEYADAQNIINKIAIKAVTKNSLDKMLPVYAITNSINNSKISITNAARDTNSPLRENVLVRGSDLIQGVEIRSTIKNYKGEVFHPSKLNELELSKVMILHEFLSNFILDNKETVSFQPTNYADKSRHTSLVINKNAKIRNIDGVEKTWATLSNTELQDIFFNSQETYYREVAEVIVKDFATILNDKDANGDSLVAKNYIANSKLLKLLKADADNLGLDWNLALTNPATFPNLAKYVGKTLAGEIDVYNKIRSFNLKPVGKKFNAHKNPIIFSKLNDLLKLLNENTIMDAFNEAKIDWYGTLYFENTVQKDSKGKLGNTLSLNKSLTYYVQDYFNANNKAKTTKSIETKFLNKLKQIGFTMDIYDPDYMQNKLIEVAEAQFPTLKDFKNLETGVLELEKDGELNPILKAYLWQHTTASRDFQLITVGSPIAHPAKVKAADVPSFIRDSPDPNALDNYLIALRLVAQNKRMVKHQATYHPYMQNLINGISAMQNRLYVKDPSVSIFTPNGELASVDIADGASIATILEVNLMNNSLLDQSVGIIHKSIGSDLDTRTGAAGLTKHAMHGITNMDIQNSPTYKQLMLRLLGKTFTQIEGQDINVDITSDFNNNKIDITSQYGDLFFSYNQATHNISPNIKDNDLVKFVDIQNIGKDQYQVTYLANDVEYKVTKGIRNLHELWTSLGAEFSLEYKADQLGKWRTDHLDGYVRSNSSWDALTIFVNKVGFYNTTAVSPNAKTLANSLVTGTPKELRTRLKRFFKEDYKYEDKDPATMSVSQYNIVQPLKINNIGQVTFTSGQKVGVKNVISLNKLLTTPSDLLNIALADTTMYGVQLNADHDVDESHSTEPTQIISTAPFSGNTAEFIDNVFSGIANYIKKNMIKYKAIADTQSMSNAQDTQLNDFLKRVVTQAFRSQNLGGFSNLIMQAIEEEKNSAIKSTFKIPVSSAQFNSMMNTTISNILTDEGVKRTFPGVAAVAKPYSGFIKFRTIVENGVSKTVTQQQYEQYKQRHPDYVNEEPLDTSEESAITGAFNNFDVMDTLRSPEGKTIYIDSPSKYYQVKNQIKEDIFRKKTGWVKILDAEHDLKPSRHRFIYEGLKGTYGIYDIPSVMYKYMVKEYVNLQVEIAKLKVSLENENLSLYEFQKAYPDLIYLSDLNLYENMQATIDLLEERVDGILSDIEKAYRSSNFSSRYLTEYNKTFANIDKDILKYVAKGRTIEFGDLVTEDEANYFKNHNTDIFKNIYDTKIAPLPFSMGEGFANLVSLESLLGQAAMATPYKSLLNLGEDQDVHDVTEETIFKSLEKASIPKSGLQYDFFLKETKGNHAYFVIKDSSAYNKLMNDYKPVEKNLEIIIENGLYYNVNAYGNRTTVSPATTEYRVSDGPNVLTYYVVESEQDFDRILNSVSTDENVTRFSDILLKLTSDTKNIPLYLDQIKKGRNLGLSEAQILSLTQVYADYKSKKDLTGDYAVRALSLYDTQWVIDEVQSAEAEIVKLKRNKKTPPRRIRDLVNYIELLRDYDTAVISGDVEAATTILKSIKNKNVDFNNLDLLLKEKLDAELDTRKNDRGLNKILSTIENSILRNLTKKNRTLSERLYVSFKKSLEIIGARIPGQDLQSYMGMEIVHFLNGQANAIYVSPWHQLYTGEDFDIDKVFTLFYSLGRDGLIKGWSPLWNDRTEDLLNTSLNLPLPDGAKKSQLVTKNENTYTFKDTDLQGFVVKPSLKDYAKDPSLFRTAALILDKTKSEPNLVLSVEQEALYGTTILDFVNKFHNEPLLTKDADIGFLNSIVSGLIRNQSDLRNVSSAHSPMSMDELNQLAKKSAKGVDMAKMSPENPGDIITAQIANMVGKEAIGIVATSGLKSWSMITNALTKIRDGKMEGFRMSRMPLLKLSSVTSGDRIKNFEVVPNTGFRGMNIGKQHENFLTWLNESKDAVEGDFVDQINILNAQILEDSNMTRPSTSASLSSLLSAATDNAKELILARINANPNTLGYYISMLSLGMDLSSIYYIMTSDLMESAIQLSSRDLFTGKDISLNQAFKYLKDGKIPTELIVNRDSVYSMVNQLIGHEYKKITPIKLKDGRTVQKALRDIYAVEKPEIAIPFETEDVGYIIDNPYKGLYNFLDLITGLKNTKFDNIYNEIYDTLSKIPIREVEKSPGDVVSTVEKSRPSRESDAWAEQSDYFTEGSELDAFQGDLLPEQETEDYVPYEEGGSTVVREKIYAPFSYLLSKAQTAFLPSIAAINDVNVVNPGDKKVERTGSADLLGFLEYINMLSNDLTKLSKFASINQGVPNRLPELFTMLKNLAVYVRTNFKFEKEYERYAIDGEATTLEVLNKIFKDPTFERDILAKNWEGQDSTVDVFTVLKAAPHSWEMLQTAFKAFEIQYMDSGLNRIVVQILDSMQFKVAEHPIVQRVANDYYLSLALSKISDKKYSESKLVDDSVPMGLTEFRVRKGDIYTIDDDLQLDISRMDDRSVFLNWMEMVVIPDLKMGVTKNENGTKSSLINTSVSNNYFIRKLVTDQMLDNATKDSYIYYKLPIDVSRADANNVDMQIEIDALKAAFASLDTIYYDNKRISDLFAMYDFIVQKDRDNSNSIKSLIASSDGDLTKDSFAVNMLWTMGELDQINFEADANPYQNMEVMKLLGLYGFGVERSYVRKNLNPEKLASYPPLIKVLVRDEQEDIFRMQPYMINPFSSPPAYQEISTEHSKKIIPIEPNRSVLEVNSFNKQVAQKKERMTRYLNNNINLNIKDC